MEFLRTVGLAPARRPAYEAGVGGQLLPGRAPRQELEEDAQLVEGRHEPLESEQRHVDAGKRRQEAGVAFVRDEADRAGLRDGEICARDADIGRPEHLGELAARNTSELLQVR